MDEIVKKVLEIIAKLSDEQKAIIIKELTAQLPTEETKETEHEVNKAEGDAAMQPRNNPEVASQEAMYQKFLQYGSTK